jgi:hypothetical protein
MTPAQIASIIRAYVAANPSPFRGQPLLSERVEDEVGPDPDCWACERGTCGTDDCRICGDRIGRVGGYWWHCHGRRDHHATPAPTGGQL